MPVLPAHHRATLGHTDKSQSTRTDVPAGHQADPPGLCSYAWRGSPSHEGTSLGKSLSSPACEPLPEFSRPLSTPCLCDPSLGYIKPPAQRTRNDGSHGHTPTTLQKEGKFQGASGTVIYLTYPEYIYPCADLYKHIHFSIWVGIYLYVPVSKYQQVSIGLICRWGDDDRQGAVIPLGCSSSGGESLGLVSLGEVREGAECSQNPSSSLVRDSRSALALNHAGK